MHYNLHLINKIIQQCISEFEAIQGFMAEKKRQREQYEKEREETQNLLRIELVNEQTYEQAQKKRKEATRLKVLTICQLCKHKITKKIPDNLIHTCNDCKQQYHKNCLGDGSCTKCFCK